MSGAPSTSTPHGARSLRARRGDLFLALAAALVALAVYVRTLAPGVTSEDSGELISAAATLGVAHPPGFPAWTLLVHLFTCLPGQPAFWANLSSAVLAASAVGLSVLVAMELGATRAAALGAALLLAFGETFWSQAVITEIYAFNAAILALVLFALLRAARAKREADEARRARWLRIAAFSAGLGLAGHYPLTLLVAPAWAAYFVAVERRGVLHRWPVHLVLLLLPLALYLYLPWAAARAPLANWGEPATWPAFRDHVLRRAYRSLELGAEVTWEDKLAFLRHAAELMLRETWIGPALAAVGVASLAARKQRAELVLLLGVILLDVPVLVAILHFRFDHENAMRVNEYYLPAWLAVALLAAIGLSRIAEKVSVWTNSSRAGWAVTAAALVPLVSGFTTNDRSKDTLAYDYTRAILESLPPNSIFFPSGDYTAFPALYLQAVEHLRTDVLLADYTGRLSPAAKALAHQLDPTTPDDDEARVQTAFLERTTRPIAFAAKSDVRAPGMVLEPWGLVYRVRRATERERTPPPDILSRPIVAPAPGLVVDDLGRSVLADHHLMRGEALADLGRLDDARKEWAASEAWSRESKEALNNLGSTLAERGLEDEAVRLFRLALAIAPDYATPRRNLTMLLRRRVAAYEAAVHERPDHAPTWNNLGSARAESGDVEGAIAAFERALAIDRGYVLACRNLAELHRRMGSETAEAARRRAGCP